MTIENPESPVGITRNSAQRIDGRILRAGHRVARTIRREGVYDTYFNAWGTMPVPLRHETRRLVNAYNDPRPRAETEEGDTTSSVRLHPFSQAAERGLIIGTVLGRELIKNDAIFERFSKRMTAQFAALRLWLADSPYDLSDALRHTGAPFADMLEEQVDPDLTDFDPHDDSPIEQQRQMIYAHAVGYVGSAAVTKLAELEMRRIAPADELAIADIGADLAFLSDQVHNLFPSDFPPPAGS